MVRRSRGDAGPDPGGGRMTVVDRNDQTKEEGSATTVLAARKPSVDEPELLRLAEAYKAKLQSWTESYQQEWPRRSWRPTSGRSTERRSTSRRSPTGPIWPRRRAPSAPGSSTRS